MNPADFIRKGVAKLNDWFEKTEREELEQRLEVAKGFGSESPQENGSGRPVTERSKMPSGDPQSEAAGIAEILPKRRDNPTPVPGGAARGEQPRDRTPREDETLYSPQGGDAYREKDRLVRQIRAVYSPFGDQIASVILQKCLMPDGVQLLATKLGLDPIGDDELDHKQIVEYLISRGTATFCESVGIRVATPFPARGGLARTSTNEGDRHSSGGEKVRMGQDMATHGRVGAESPVLKMSQTELKPANLTPSSEGTEECQDPVTLPSRHSVERGQASSTPPPFPPSPHRPLQVSNLGDRPMTPVPIQQPQQGLEGMTRQPQQPRHPLPPPQPSTPPEALQPVALKVDSTPRDGTGGASRTSSAAGQGGSDPRVPPPGPNDPLRATPLPGQRVKKSNPADETTAERKAADFLRDELEAGGLLDDD
jgi:hypothetical protein